MSHQQALLPRDDEDEPSYIAAVHLPTGLPERLLNSAEKLTVTFAANGTGTLCVGDESFSFSTASEANYDCVRAEPDGFRLLGPVDDKITVRPNAESSRAARAQLANSKALAEDARKERTTERLPDSRGAKKGSRAAPPAPPKPTPQPLPKKRPAPAAAAPSAVTPAAAARPPLARSASAPSSSSSAAKALRPAASSITTPVTTTMNQMAMPHPAGASSSASQGPQKKEEDLEDWGVHLLALAPQGLLVSSLQSKLVQAKRERKLAYHPGTEISIRRVLSKVAEEAGPNKLKLRSTMLDRASLQWPHYSAAQRATLELIRNPSGAKEEEDVADSDSDDDRPLAEQVARLQQQEQPPAKRAKSEATPAAAAAPAAVRAASAPAAAAQARRLQQRLLSGGCSRASSS